MSTDPKATVRARIDGERERLVDLSHRIHARPELCFEEVQASGWLADALDEAGFRVERGVCGLPTAFDATFGSGPLHVAFCAEYDALPGIGHACGHNLIATSSLGAGFGLAEVADDIGVTVHVLGTPAEEGGGGKILLLERGAFDGVHAAMMVHPVPTDLTDFPIIASTHFTVRYTGKSSHAASFPELGINAADALVVAQTSIGLLRQHFRSGERVHGIVTKGGDAPNIIPAHTEGVWQVRAPTLADLGSIQEKVERCFHAGALATGATVDIEHASGAYAELRQDADLLAAYRRNAEAAGRRFADFPRHVLERSPASSDIGNVSLVLPTIQPGIGLGSFPAVPHQPEFAAYCVTEVADQALADGALALAWTAVDAATDTALRERLLSP